MDTLYVALLLLFFVLTFALAGGCAALRRNQGRDTAYPATAANPDTALPVPGARP